MTHYKPLDGVKVLDLGVLIPAALTSMRLAALGADVVKIERPSTGDRIRRIPPYGQDGESPQHMAQNWGKRSIALDIGRASDLQTLLALIKVADVVVENQLAGYWAEAGVDFAALRAERPELIVCSVTGFGQTGPWATLPAHGLNVDALGDGMVLNWQDGRPSRGWAFTSWGNELGALSASVGVCAAIAAVRGGGEGAWIDVSCWDALVESHRTELSLSHRSGEPLDMHAQGPEQALYTTYLSADGVPVLLGALEPKFWKHFCVGIGREDLLGHHKGEDLEYGDGDAALHAELTAIFAGAEAKTWLARFLEWDVPGGPVLNVDQIMKSEHYAARKLLEGPAGTWPNVTSALRWHHTGTRAGAELAPPPAFDQHSEEIRNEWLG